MAGDPGVAEQSQPRAVGLHRDPSRGRLGYMHHPTTKHWSTRPTVDILINVGDHYNIEER